MYLYYTLSGLFNALTGTLLGILLYKKNKNSKANKALALFCFSIAAWSYPYSLWPLMENKELSLFIFRALHFGAIFVPITYFHFVIIWLKIYKQKKWEMIIGYCLAIFFCFFVFSPLFVTGVEPKFAMQWWGIPGTMYYIYLFYFFFFFIHSSIILFLGYLKSEGNLKIQIKIILIGIVISVIAGSTNYFLWFDINIPPYGNILASTYVILSVYTIIHHQFMNIKLILRKSSVYIASLITILGLALIIKYLFVILLPSNIPWADIIILVLALSSFSIIKTRYYQIANKYFFSSLYDDKKLIEDISDKLHTTLDENIIYKYIFDTLRTPFHIQSFGFLKYNQQEQNYKIRYSDGFNGNNQKIFSNNDILQYAYIEKNLPVIIDNVKNTKEEYEANKRDIDTLTLWNIGILIPVHKNNKTLGLLALGHKDSGEMYNNEDTNTLKVISSLVATALENAQLYKKVKEKNVYLEELLHMKSEFLRVVNHQLNTPVSIMRLGLSSINDKTVSAEEGLKIVNEGMSRISNILSDLWTAYEMEGVKIKMDISATNIKQIIEKMIEEKKFLSLNKERNLKIVIHYPNYEIPLVLCDPKKIVYVISNLLDNAIFYTKTGQVTISFETITDKNSLKIYVTDTGMGINEKDQQKLFKKFSRGSYATSLKPDGSGLGLYISKQIIEGNNGILQLEKTEEGKGSTFSIELPLFAE